MRPLPSELLRDALRAIPKGQVSEKARLCGVDVPYFLRMRREPKNVGIDMFRGICEGLGVSADELLGLPAGLMPGAAQYREAERQQQLLARELGRYQRLLRRIYADVSQIVEAERTGATPSPAQPAPKAAQSS